ncbi:MAG: hypothetical protein IJU23_10950 [Proteobacteria bacterium]|nr:hypothetical protein [Pseudomonadota bacterium]
MDCETYCELTAEFRDDLRTLITVSSRNTDEYVLGNCTYEQAQLEMRKILRQMTLLQKKYRELLS